MRPLALLLSRGARIREPLAAALGEALPEAEVRAVDADALDALDLPAPPRLVCADVDLATDDGLALLIEARARFRDCPIVVHGNTDPSEAAARVERAGALSYLHAGYTPRQKALVLQLAWEGLGHLPPRPVPPTPQFAEGDTRGLTPKQIEVLSCIVAGMSNREIADRLGIVVGTVKLHVTAILKKLQVDTRARAIRVAGSMGVVIGQLIADAEHNAPVLDWLLGSVTHRRHRAGDILFRKGDPGGELFYLQRGIVALDDLGKEMGPRSVFGEIAAFSPGNARTSTARCKTDVDLFCLDEHSTKVMCYENPQFALYILNLLAGRLAAVRGV